MQSIEIQQASEFKTHTQIDSQRQRAMSGFPSGDRGENGVRDWGYKTSWMQDSPKDVL